MKTRLRNGQVVEDARLDRLIFFDGRSRGYPVGSLVAAKKPRSYTWRCNTNLDQKNEGSCVAHGVAHELAARPAEVKNLTSKYAKERIYWEAQKIDPWPGGSYPGATPRYEGTSVLAGVKVAQSLGYFDSYHWSFGLDELILGVGYAGPAVLGLAWLEGMGRPDSGGYIHATGRVRGGHCILCKAVSVKRERFTLHNSWGRGWGVSGSCYISFGDMGKLLAMSGEAVFFKGRKTRV